MSAEHGWLLLAAGIGSALMGVAMLSALRRRIDARRTRAVDRSAGLTDALTCASISAAAIVGMQWAMAVCPGPPVLWAAAHGVPALLAGATVARLSAVASAMRDRKRRARASRRGIGCR